MPHEPKKRHSRQRQGKRRAALKLGIPQTVTCANCGIRQQAHVVCASCGFYKGQQLISLTVKEGQVNENAK